MPQTTLHAERGELAQQVVDTLKSDEEPITTGVNLRDAATTSPETIINGRVFRSSQVFMCARRSNPTAPHHGYTCALRYCSDLPVPLLRHGSFNASATDHNRTPGKRWQGT